MLRRRLLAGATAAAGLSSAGLPRPAIAQASAKPLRFVPEGNLQNPDPIWTASTIARNFGYMVWDTLYGVDANLNPKPQMVEGHEVSADGLTWRFRLREGLRWHDGAPVRPADCIASLGRWMKRDGLGLRLEAVLEEMQANGDRGFTLRLKKPFPLLLVGLSKPSAAVCFMMPERIASTDPFKQIDDYVGSGPFRFLRNEWTPGALAAFAKFDGYSPRQEKPDFTSGGKAAMFDRIEWNVIPDAATAAAAMQNGEAEWWQSPTVDLLPVLRKARGVVVEKRDRFGAIGTLRFNLQQPPFNNPKLRRALWPAIDQADFMAAAMAGDTELSRTGVGVFTPGSPMATEIGMDILTGPRDLARARKLVAESGYAGERVVFLAPTDYPVIYAMAQVARDMLRKVGINVEPVDTDWGTMIQRRNNREGVDKGGWSAFCVTWEGLSLVDPVSHFPIFGNGYKGWFGWMESQKLEDLRTAWFDAPDLAAQKKIAEQIQLDVWDEVPYYPLGQTFTPVVRRANIVDMVDSPFPLFWNVRRA